MRNSIITKFILIIVSGILISNVFLGYMNYKNSEKLKIEQIIEKNHSELKSISEYYFKNLIADMEFIVNTWAHSDELKNYNKLPNSKKYVNSIPEDFNDIHNKWIGLTKSADFISWIYFAFEQDGSIFIAPVDETMPKDYDARKRDWYIETVNNGDEFYWSSPYLDAGDSGKIIQTVSKAVYQDDKLKGVLGLDIEVTRFTTIINNLALSKNSLIFLVNNNNDIIAHNSVNSDYYYDNFIKNINSNTEIIQKNKSKFIVSWVPIDINGWKLVSISQTNFEDSLSYIKSRIIALVVLTIVIVLYISYLLSRNLMNPLKELMTVTKEVRMNNFEVRSFIKTNDEFSSLSNSFNHMLSHIENLLIERDDNYIKTVKTLANAIEASDKYTRGHCDRVGRISLRIADKINLDDKSRKNLEFACILHDLGKIGIPFNILNKPGKLDEHEYDLIKEHPTIGYDVLKDIEFLEETAEIILQHHERIDGFGYPHKLQGSEIRLEAKILAVADVYDAMTSFRVYRETNLTNEEVKKELIQSKNKQLDAVLVDILISLIEDDNITIIDSTDVFAI